jgi:superfamily II DNA helicase RecQ
MELAHPLQDIESGKYSVVITSPELLMDVNGPFVRLWKKKRTRGQIHFLDRLLYFVIDEADRVTSWASFRQDYSLLYRLRSFVPTTIPFLAASATLRPCDIGALMDSLRMNPEDITQVLRSNDRPDIAWSARFMEHSASSFHDLDFALCHKPSTAPDTFLVFHDSTDETVEAVLTLRERLPKELQEGIVWFNSSMSDEYRERIPQELGTKYFGMCTTEAFGMVRLHFITHAIFSNSGRALTSVGLSLSSNTIPMNDDPLRNN